MIWPFRFEPLSISIGAAAGIALQIMIHHYLAGRRDEKAREARELHEAKSRFREAILAELSIFLLQRAYWPTGVADFLLQAVPKLQPAVQAYRAYVRTEDPASFDKAWVGLVGFCNERIRDNDYATAKMYPSMRGKDSIEVLREHVNRLLSFA